MDGISDSGNLVVSREPESSVVLDLRQFGLGLFEVTYIERCNGKARLAFKGDKRVPVWRREVFEAKERAA